MFFTESPIITPDISDARIILISAPALLTNENYIFTQELLCCMIIESVLMINSDYKHSMVIAIGKSPDRVEITKSS